MALLLSNRTVALAEGRQLEELAGLLEREGASCLRYPLLSILDPDDDGPALVWIGNLISDRFDWVIFLTGEGVRRLHGCAERHGQADAFVSALGRVSILTRGPKPGRALRELQLQPTRVAPAPTTDGVIEALKTIDVRGKNVGVQLYKPTNPPLEAYLLEAGAKVQPVLPYIYAPATDSEKVVELIQAMAAGKVDALVLTSSPQIDRLFEVGAEHHLDAVLREGLEKSQVAAVGPIVAENLRERGIRVDLCPEQGWVMKNLVQLIKRKLGPQ